MLKTSIINNQYKFKFLYSDKSTSSLKKKQKKEAKEKEDQGSSFLDRRPWTFLGIGIGRDSNEPVPTSQFRSYRRIRPTAPKRTSDSSSSSNSSNLKWTVY